MLKVIALQAGYGVTDVLKGVSLEVRPGEIVALLGANGAGKSTALLTLAGVARPRGGEVLFEGESLRQLRTDEILQRGLCLCPEGRRIFPRLTVQENLSIGAYLRPGKLAGKIERIYHYFPILAERRQQLGGTLSGGEQQMLAIGRAMLSEPQILMLDEPSLGLAPLIVEQIFRIIETINREGTAVLLVEQNARQALQIAQRGYVLVTGEIRLSGSSQELMGSQAVREAYLGE